MKNRICAYCHKQKKLTKEHIWPKCIINRMPELGLKFLDSKKIVTSSELVISDVELNPPSRVAVSKVPDSFYTRKLLTTKIFDYEKEIGFYYR